MSVEGIKNFSGEAVLNNIQNYYEGSVINSGPVVNHNCSFNPLDKVVELYERLVLAEKEKVEYLEKLLKGK
ncbi:hypothetical protein [Pseudomonas shirazensis]